MKQTKWFDRQFPVIEDSGLLPTILERLEGTGTRLTAKVQRIDFAHVAVTSDRWSIKKEIGHLLDLEPLWLERANQILNNTPLLSAADLTNKKTNETNHDDRPAMELVTAFSKSRQQLVDLLRNIKDEDVDKASIHPRLGTPMKLVDLAYFIAEHDDHHLARITELSRTN